MIPTASHPLTPAFASTGSDCSNASPLPPALDISSSLTLPAGHHPATPRFLLSLLATAVYLSIPSVASQALSAIVRTIGPHTAVRYLNFAIGHGIGPPGTPEIASIGMDQEIGAAAGLEDVAELIKEDDISYESIDRSTESQHKREVGKDAATTSSSSAKRETAKHTHNHGTPDSDAESDSESEGNSTFQKAKSQDMLHAQPTEPCYYYGAVSDKVGEAAACWLTRWGVDILRYEEQAIVSDTAERGGTDQKVPWSPSPHHVQWAGDRPASAPPETANSRSGGRVGGSNPQPVAPVVWRRGGLSARWIRGIISSDALFVRGEKERYEMAKNVVEMRRAASAMDGSGESEELEELEFGRLFTEGIYYANMHLDDLMSISKDVSRSTGKPFVPLATLQAALWNQSTLYHKITHRPAGSASPSLSPTNATKELGLGTATANIEQLASHPDESLKAFYPVPGDSSLRLGDSTGLEGASMDQLFDPQYGSGKRSTPLATEANFFGLEQARRPATAFASSSSPLSAPVDPEARWTAHPPFRFAVEFWDVDALKEKSRLHSHTVWYAGSLYNVYVQVVRKKGVQLGIYLHRQSTVDPIPPSSAPTAGMLSPPPRDRSVRGRGPSSSVSSPRPPSAMSGLSIPRSPLRPSGPPTPATPVAPGSPIAAALPAAPAFSRSSTTLHTSSTSVGSITVASPVSLPATAPPVTPPQPYRDPRPAVSAYFTIACASATGASLTRFTSAPDVFSVSQSWGWKSSSLRTEEYLEVDANGQPAPVIIPAGREVSLRATVVLGVV
ncbi:hypothetical protein DICSQDRAFT_172988 [Dichomitus squalens LYAD-421 SS1]|uniref:Uncharacterized protein n=1 Tax=Dichomitus squalens (strain LYAD-421) TaxID=732165 RepID=R7SRT5_DICSQ|nr:uncharacterized protein DICSQDRAFT_172988 [Dichomitus squalens LYAD-421 SS1]EJF58475.1 hypothetical protein DICSQDRAFT_172988 [Dichomitus squalens LYAD-421 SS1]